MKTLHFSVSIASPRRLVWDAMLGPETFRQWTAVFAPGSYYEGSWEQGAKIRFLTPSGEGMTAEIAENRPYERVSIRQQGMVKDFVDDTDSPAARSLASAYENYTFSDKDGMTEVRVDVDATPEMEQMLVDAYPRALQELKRICENMYAGVGTSPHMGAP